jgi:hypothetical protein
MARGRQADSARHRQRVVAVLSKAGAGETEISVSGIARGVGVDRTFLYRYRDLLAQIHALEATPPAATVNEVLSGHVALDIECLDRKSRSFITRGLADSYRAELVRAARSGLAFDPATGEPSSWAAPATATAVTLCRSKIGFWF